MNKESLYVDGKVIVADENGMKPPIDYVDNVDEILKSQNLIEVIEELIKIKKQSLKYKRSDPKLQGKQLKVL